MSWLVICLVLLVAFGPVLWLVPSRRDRRLSSLRSVARAEGLIVELKQIPKTNPSAAERVSPGGVVREPVVQCAAYTRVLHGKLKRLPQWRLLKSAGATDGPRPGWTFDPLPSGPREYLDESLASVDNLLDELPSDVVGVELMPHGVTVFWLEGPQSDDATVALLARLLEGAEGELAALERRIEETFLDEDS